ncbi:MAG: T9SS type A sorting domain-containing protein, partial [Bacteroidota bacterium]
RAKGPNFPPTLNNAGRVFVYERCSPRFTALQDTLCAGEELWFAGEWLSTSGQYVEDLLADSGCDSTVTLDLFVYPEVETGLSQTDTSLTAEATEATFQWLACEQGNLTPILGATQGDFFPDSSGWYAVIVDQFDGCVDTSECVEITLPLVSSTADWTQTVEVFPNPSSGEVQIRFFGFSAPWSYQLYDLQGRLIEEKADLQAASHSLELEDGPGVYLLHLRDQTGRQTWRKLVRE